MRVEAPKPAARRRKPWLPERLSPAYQSEISDAILDGAFATRRFYVLLALSTIIAAGGLLSNSAAVIIGAMIVAPLMGPILGLSMGMVSGRPGLERGALLAEITGVALAVGLAFGLGLVPLNLGMSDEMLARTSPTAYDLVIAFVSGLAGAYASTNRKVNNALAGVAISVALVPPLATCGLLLAMGHRREAWGAFLLFAANFFSIQLAAAAVFGMYGFGRTEPRSRTLLSLTARFLPGVVAMLLMAWFMTGTLVGLVRDHNLETTVRKVLNEEIARRSGGRLEAILRREERNERLELVASALTPQVFEPSQVLEIERALSASLKQDVRLVLRSVVSQDIDDHGRVFLNDAEREQSQRAKDDAEFLVRASEILKGVLRDLKGAELDGLDRRDADGQTALVALVRGPEIVDPATVEAMEAALDREIGGDVRLIVRSVATRDADRQGFLYEAKPTEAAPPDPAAERLRDRVRDAVRRRMARKPARSLDELRIEPEGLGNLRVRATVTATLPVRPREIAAIEADLRRFLDPRLRLTVRTVLGSEATPRGWTP